MSEFIRTARQFVEIPSTGGNLEALEQAVTLMERQFYGCPDIHSQRFHVGGKPSLLVYYGDHIPAEFDVLFLGHLDVVPGKIEQFYPQIKGRYMYGRGTMDAKLTALGMAHALRQPMANRVNVGGLFTTQEEDDGQDVQYLTEKGIVASKFVVAGEPTQPTEICTEYKGLAHVKVNIQGRNAHEARQWEGENAILALYRYISKLNNQYPQLTQDEWRTTVTPVDIYTTNSAGNRVPDFASADVRFRMVPGDPNVSGKHELQAFLESLMAEAKGQIVIEGFARPVSVDHNHPFLNQLANAIGYVHSIPDVEVKRVRAPWSSDGRFFNNAQMYGMSGDGLHGDDERLDMTTIKPYVRSLRRFLGELSVA